MQCGCGVMPNSHICCYEHPPSEQQQLENMVQRQIKLNIGAQCAADKDIFFCHSSLFGMLPEVAALIGSVLSIIWFCIRIYETDTIKKFLGK